MNCKPTILVSENKTIFQSWYLEDIWEKYFNIEIIDLNKDYDTRSTVVCSDQSEFVDKTNVNECKLASKGIRHIIDHCWDSWNSNLDNYADFVLRPKDFIRINESIWYKGLGYDKIELHSRPNFDFLLLMNKKNSWRTKLYERLFPVLDNNVYSYVENNISLQNAKDQEFNDTTWQRYIDPNWYTSTRFSIVSESQVYKYIVKGLKKGTYLGSIPNVSEKTIKPCAFKHPYIVWGQTGTLEWQRRQGFETFDHCIDESYDSIEDTNIRFEKLIEQIDLCINDKTIFTDTITQQKIEHNYNHFYNKKIVMELFQEQMVDPLMEFIES